MHNQSKPVFQHLYNVDEERKPKKATKASAPVVLRAFYTTPRAEAEVKFLIFPVMGNADIIEHFQKLKEDSEAHYNDDNNNLNDD